MPKQNRNTMKKEFYYLCILLTSVLFFSCSEDEPKNQPPTCTITSPNNGEEIEAGIPITISVDTDDRDGHIAEVRFYVDGTDVSSSSNFSYNYDWYTSDESTGSHTLKVTAIDNSGEQTTDEIGIFITDRRGTGIITDIEDNTYNTVTIGTQEWMAENLKTTHYPNGKAILLVTDNTVWANLRDNDADKAYCYYENSLNNRETYGALYTYAAAKDACPTGWHLPTDEEWATLENFVHNDGYLSNALKATTGWSGERKGTDNYGFSALPAGRRTSDDGAFEEAGNNACWWSNTEIGSSYTYNREIRSFIANLYRSTTDMSLGVSVRCVRD